MDSMTLLQQLIAARDRDERLALLNKHAPPNAAFFKAVKDRVRELVRQDSREALRVADIGVEAAAFASRQEGVAYAWWARGNALLFSGQHDDCLAAYSTAISMLADPDEVAQLQTNCMLPLMDTGRYAEAQAMGQSALNVLSAQGDSRPVANLWLNMGICALRQGDHAGALAKIERAADIFDRLGDGVESRRCRVTQAVALEYLDRFKEAELLLRECLQVFADRQVWTDWARAALNLGVLYARLADHQTALRWLEESRRGFEQVGIEMDAAVADLYRAQCFLDVNLLPEAETLSRELVETFSRLKMPRQVARAASLLAEGYMRKGRLDQARFELDRARQIYRAEGDSVEVALLDIPRAELLRAAGRPAEALRLATEAAEALDVFHYPLRHAEAHLVIAACCQDLGLIEEAQMAYRVAWEAGSYPTGLTEPPPALAYRIAYARGTIAEAAGDYALARGEYGRAINYLERINRGLGLDELRGGYLANKRPVYETALRLALDNGRTGEAFRYSELARAGALRDFLAHRQPCSELLKSTRDIAALEKLRARWAWRVSRLHQPVDLAAEANGEIVEQQDGPTRLRELAELERALADAYRNLRLSEPRFAALAHAEVLELERVYGHLPNNSAMLAFDSVGDSLFAFVITPGRTEIAPLGSLNQLRWDAAALGHALEEIHLFDEPADLARLEADLLRDLRVLYNAVLARPLARLGPQVRCLLIVPCDVLHTLPLEALYDGRQYLIERYAVCYLPAASVLPALPGGRRLGAGRPLVMANSWDGRLPLALDEAARVAQAVGRATSDHQPLAAHQEPLVLTEKDATAKALREQADSISLLHLAAHGEFRADAPLFSSLRLADGPLTVNDVYGLDLSQAALVTLSGCQTGLGQGRGGEMLGLTHAFFFAGAPTLVVSRWRVDDAITAQLMQDFYTALARGETVAEAMRTAQLSVLAGRPHAGYWAAFAVWGRGFEHILDIGYQVLGIGDGGKTASIVV